MSAWDWKNLWPAGTERQYSWLDDSPVKTCSHYREEFTFLNDTRTLYLSGHRAGRKATATGVVPTAALYLDKVWLSDVVVGMRQKGEPFIAYASWPDMSVVSLRRLKQLTSWLSTVIGKGHAVEVGCIGGHGRTGTLAAALMVHEGVPAEEAITKVRRDYCKHAIETSEQEELVKEADKLWNLQ